MLFHPDYSCGTAAAKGSQPLTPGGEYYWEIKMTSAVYGTDMVGDMSQIKIETDRSNRHGSHFWIWFLFTKWHLQDLLPSRQLAGTVRSVGSCFHPATPL